MSSSTDKIRWYAQHEGKTDQMRKEVGNAFWNYQHTLSNWIPPLKQEQLAAFENLKSGVKNFPCKECSGHGMSYMESHPFNTETEDFKHYVWAFHNDVNKRIGKPEYPFTKVAEKQCVPKAAVEKFTEMGEVEMLDLLMSNNPVCEA